MARTLTLTIHLGTICTDGDTVCDALAPVLHDLAERGVIDDYRDDGWSYTETIS